MRNLKKILALVLALVMVVGMMSIATAATAGTGYSDDAAITTYDEAVQVLSQLKIYKGNEAKAFNPKAPITRGEFAALVYRIVHQDVSDTYTGIYADYNKFKDVNSTDWFAGYVNYCANGEYIVGDGANFYPGMNVNGYQVLAVMLRALGYDREDEFRGTGWEIRTARKAKELGITKNVLEGTLGAPASRELVAELIFRSLLCETQNWALISSYVGTKKTLGYESFKLRGVYDNQGDVITKTNNGIYIVDSTTGIERQNSTADAVADNKYGEPVKFWAYTTPAGKDTYITVRYNPVASSVTGLTSAGLYSVLAPIYDPYATGTIAPCINMVVDGGADDTIGAAKLAATTVLAGKGAEADVYLDEDYDAYVVVKNVYSDKVYAAYKLNLDGTIKTNFTTDNAYAIDSWNNKTLSARLAGFKVNDVVTYNKYGITIDSTTVEAPKAENVVVTNTYDTTSASTSYFLAGKKYEYNCNYGSYISSVILNRDEDSWDDVLEATDAFDKKQTVYTDKNGYVVHTTDTTPAQALTGYMVLTGVTFNNYQADNGYYLVFTGFDAEGKAVSVKGGINTFTYGDNGSANVALSAQFAKGLYHYTYDSGTGLYKMTALMDTSLSGTPRENANTNAIPAGDPDALHGDYLLDDNTVFVVANYNNYGFITGYTVKTGLKNIPDLTDAGKVNANGDAWTATGNVDYKVQWVDHDIVLEGLTYAQPTVDLVYVEGAKQAADSVGTAIPDSGFILTDVVPEDFVITYDTHKVVKAGTAGTMNFVPDFVATKSLNKGGYYYVDATTNGYVSSVSLVTGTPAELVWLTDGVLSATGLADPYVVLSNNCKVYSVSTATGTCTVVDDVTAIDTVTLDTAYGTTTVAYVAAYDAYGFASVIYIVK